MMGTICWAFLVSLCLYGGSEAKTSRLSLDMSDIHDVNNQQLLSTHAIQSFLGHLATDIFNLKLNPKAMQSMTMLQNISEAGVSYNGLTEAPQFRTLSEKAFEAISAKLPEESLLLLKAMLRKNLKVPVLLRPSDDNLPETINFINAIQQYWQMVDEVGPLKIEEFDPLSVPSNIKDILEERKNNSTISKRNERKFITPELPFQVSEENLENLLSNVFIEPRNHETAEGVLEKSVIRAFITKKFEEFGLQVYNHEFSSSQSLYWFGEELIGTNIIGILAGDRWGTSEDAPLIIGAHYDTVHNTTGTIDNASGTSSVIEAARMLTSSGCKYKNSIIFVAFDLEEIGTHGAFMFVKDFLLKLIFPTYGIKSITGALILDCIANWDPNTGSQIVAGAWEEKIVGLKENIEEKNNTGDFLAVMYRESPDGLLASKLSYYYNGLGDPKYRLQMLPLKNLLETRPNVEAHVENMDFFRSDHFRFWYPSEVTPNTSLPALLLTDTGPYRGNMTACYHAPCDIVPTISPDIGFLAKITRAASWVIADLALGYCGPTGVFSIPEMFQIAKEREMIEAEPVETKRPTISIDGIMEILKYIGRVGSVNTLSLDETKKGTTTVKESMLLNIPLHRFRISHKDKKGKSITAPQTKLTISIHGQNSAFLIPLKITATSNSESRDHHLNITLPTTENDEKISLHNVTEKSIT